MSDRFNNEFLYLRREDVKMACQHLDSVALMRKVFELHATGQTILPDEAYLAWQNSESENVRSLNMPGYVGGPFNSAGTKIINSNPQNPTRGHPRASGLTLLFDSFSTEIICIMEGAYISSLRTSSVSALAAECLKGPRIESLAVIGAGELARAHIRLLSNRIADLRQVLLFDIDRRRVDMLQSELQGELADRGVSIMPASTTEQAVRDSQLIIPVTTTTSGYIEYDWLQLGAILINVSLDDAMPDVVLKADKVIVDDWNLVKNDSRRLIGRMYREGSVIGPDDLSDGKDSSRRIDAQLGDVITGAKNGRGRLEDIILVNPFGLAIEDVALATEVYKVAKERGFGQSLAR